MSDKPKEKEGISQEEGMKILVEESRKRTEMSQQRSIMSEERTYTNYERTLSVWVRTALAAMAFGIAVDRLGAAYDILTLSTYTGAILVIYSMLVALFAGIRFIFLVQGYKKAGYEFIDRHKIWLPTLYSFMVVLFGGGLLVFMIWID